MLALITALLQASPLQDKTIVGYSGIPQVSGSNLAIVSHAVTLTISKNHVEVSSLTLVKNNGPAGTMSISVPVGSIGGSAAPSDLTASWANEPFTLAPNQTTPPRAYEATVPVKYLGSYALRIKYSAPVGIAGLNYAKRVVAYSLASPVSIGTLMVTYAYAPGVVFHVPEVGPGTGWEVGPRGAFLKRTNYNGQLGISFCAFYPAGFGD